MSVGYAIARIIGTGVVDDVWRPDCGVHAKAFYPEKVGGVYKYNWCLVMLKDYENATGQDLFKFQLGNLDMQVKDIPLAKRQATKAKLDALGVPTAWIKNTHTLRQIIRRAGRHLNISFKVLGERFD